MRQPRIRLHECDDTVGVRGDARGAHVLGGMGRGGGQGVGGGGVSSGYAPVNAIAHAHAAFLGQQAPSGGLPLWYSPLLEPSAKPSAAGCR